MFTPAIVRAWRVNFPTRSGLGQSRPPKTPNAQALARKSSAWTSNEIGEKQELELLDLDLDVDASGKF